MLELLVQAMYVMEGAAIVLLLLRIQRREPKAKPMLTIILFAIGIIIQIIGARALEGRAGVMWAIVLGVIILAGIIARGSVYLDHEGKY